MKGSHGSRTWVVPRLYAPRLFRLGAFCFLGLAATSPWPCCDLTVTLPRPRLVLAVTSPRPWLGFDAVLPAPRLCFCTWCRHFAISRCHFAIPSFDYARPPVAISRILGLVPAVPFRPAEKDNKMTTNNGQPALSSARRAPFSLPDGPKKRKNATQGRSYTIYTPITTTDIIKTPRKAAGGNKYEKRACQKLQPRRV